MVSLLRYEEAKLLYGVVMLMAAVVPRETLVTYKPSSGTKVNLSTAEHVVLAHKCEKHNLNGGDPVAEEEQVPVLYGGGGGRNVKSPLVHYSSLPSPTGSIDHVFASELNHSSGSLSSLCHANTNGSVPNLARAAINRANTRKSPPAPLRNSTSSSAALSRSDSPIQLQHLGRTNSLGSDIDDSRRTSVFSNATEETSLAVPIDEEEDGAEDPRIAMLKAGNVAFTPVVVNQHSTRLDQHSRPRPVSPSPANIQLRRSGVLSDRSRRANYRAAKNVSFDCETRTETFETELTESETDEREFVRLMGRYDRRPHLRIPLSPDEEYCPPGKEEDDFLPKVLCFALALVITGGILYGLNILVTRLNMNFFAY